MPLPSPRKNQNRKDFISNCMSDEGMKGEFSDPKQRAAVCHSKWKDSKGAVEIDFTDQIKKLQADKKAGYPPKCNSGYEVSDDGKKCVKIKEKAKDNSYHEKEKGQKPKES